MSFTDDRNNAETRTSVPTVAVAAAPNREATGSPTIAGSPQVRETLKADTANIADEDGLDDVSYSYQWLAAGSNIDGATGSSFTLTASQQGQTIQVRVGFTDDAGNRETLTSQATDAVAAKPIPLTASFSGVPGSHSGSGEFTFDLSFSENVKAVYERIRDKAFDIDDGDITKAQRKQQGSNQTWTITVEPDGNGAISITLPETTGCDADGAICTGGGKKLSGTVELTVNGPEQQSQEQPNNPATGLPTITGNPQVDQTLTADTSAIADEDGLDNVSYSYQWLADDGEIQGAISSTYELSDYDVGKTIRVRVSLTDDAGNQESLTSEATAAVTPRPNSPATGAPTISGTAQTGQTLTADTSGITDEDGLTSVSYSYQWIRSDGSTNTDIDSTTASTYAVSDDDVGQTIRVRVNFTDDRDNEETLTSAATDTVAAHPNSPATGVPTISGTVQAGKTLSADVSGNQRRRRAVQRFLQPPVARRRRRDTGSHRLDLRTDRRRGGEGHQGQGDLHRQRR